MTLHQLRVKLEAQADEFDRLGALVPAGKLCRSILQDLEMIGAEAAEILSMQEASQHSGYSEDHLARLVKQGKLPTLRPAGSRTRYAFRRGDLPQKPGRRHTLEAGVHDLASRLFRGKEAKNGRS